MFYIAKNGTETYRKLDDIITRAVSAKIAVFKFVEKEFNEEGYYSPLDCWGGLIGVCFKKNSIPTGWIKMKTVDGYRPHKKSKMFIDIRAKIKALPIVKKEELNNAINFGSMQYVGRLIYTGPSEFHQGKNFCLFRVNEKLIDAYKHPSDVQEVTYEVYKEYKRIIKEERENEVIS